MRNQILLTILAASVFAQGCNPTGEPVEFANACTAENSKKTIAVTGFLQEKHGIFCSNTSGRLECGYELVQNAGEKKGFSADIEVGSGANTGEKPPKGFKIEDLQIRDNAGELVKIGDRVKLTGKITSVKDAANSINDVCYMQVYKIER